MFKRKINFLSIQWESYIWLFYLPYSVSLHLPIQSKSDIFWLVMSAAFLLTYIVVTEIPRWRMVSIPNEVVITCSFLIFDLNPYMIIFTAWQVSFILAWYPISYFYVFATVYYGSFVIAAYNAYVTSSTNFNFSDMMGIIFPIFSPVVAYVFSRSVRLRRQMRQENRRLETLVRRGERERIARDLHDTLGQSFSMITIKTELAKKLLNKYPEQVAGELDDIEKTSRQNLQLVRGIVNDLHKKSIGEILFEQGQNLAEANIFMMTENENDASEWPTEIQNEFAALLVEAITNVIRHSRARQVKIEFMQKKSMYQVNVQDDGHPTSFVRKSSNGISGMKNRIESRNGKFEILKNEVGTLVRFELPKE
nr:sensor histidine kinase [Pediococcus stilesii]